MRSEFINCHGFKAPESQFSLYCGTHCMLIYGRSTLEKTRPPDDLYNTWQLMKIQMHPLIRTETESTDSCAFPLHSKRSNSGARWSSNRPCSRGRSSSLFDKAGVCWSATRGEWRFESPRTRDRCEPAPTRTTCTTRTFASAFPWVVRRWTRSTCGTGSGSWWPSWWGSGGGGESCLCRRRWTPRSVQNLPNRKCRPIRSRCRPRATRRSSCCTCDRSAGTSSPNGSRGRGGATGRRSHRRRTWWRSRWSRIRWGLCTSGKGNRNTTGPGSSSSSWNFRTKRTDIGPRFLHRRGWLPWSARTWPGSEDSACIGRCKRSNETWWQRSDTGLCRQAAGFARSGWWWRPEKWYLLELTSNNKEMNLDVLADVKGFVIFCVSKLRLKIAIYTFKIHETSDVTYECRSYY